VEVGIDDAHASLLFADRRPGLGASGPPGGGMRVGRF
jgi:hypothetical protein